MTMSYPKTTVTAPGDRELVIQRVFDAPRELVFRAYTDPEALVRWWGPREWTTEVRSMDVRPGGRWHYVMRGPGGEEAWGIATYREVVPPERLVYTDAFSDAEGSTVPPEMEITVIFEDQGGKTLLSSTTLFASTEERQQVIEMGVVEGMGQTLDRLDEYLAL